MVYCINCGIELDDDAEFCSNCGFSLKSPTTQESTNQKSSSNYQANYSNIIVTKDSKNEIILSIIGLILSVVNIPLGIYYYVEGMAFANKWLPESLEYMGMIDTTSAPYLNQWGHDYVMALYNKIVNHLFMFVTGSIIFFISSIIAFCGIYLFYKKKEANILIFTIAGIINLLIGIYFSLFKTTIGHDTVPYYVGEFHILGIISIVSAIIFIIIAILAYKKKREAKFMNNF